MSEPVPVSAAAARRIALAAQGFAKPRPAKATRAHVERVIARLGLLQIDAVNVVARAHYMPLYARLGAYDPALLDTVWLGKKRSTFEYWGHEASILPLEAHPLFRWRMEGAARGEPVRGGAPSPRWIAYAKENRAYLDRVRAELRARGPLGAADLSEAGDRKGPWWGWSDGKTAMEYLFRIGEVTTAARRGFERVYDFTERVVPEAIRARPPPRRSDAVRALALHALRALGVATAADIADYYRLQGQDVKTALAELVEEGAALPARVQDWKQPAFLDPDASAPRRIRTHALISPFDPLVWRRERALRLFGMDYRIEIYVPAEKRVFGYYVLPFLLDDAIAARLDLKADRARGALIVQAAHHEPHARIAATLEALTAELDVMRAWLGLEKIEVVKRGDLAPALARALS